MGVSVPICVLPSSTGLPSKRYPYIGFLSKADREIRAFWHVSQPTRLRLAFPRESSLILRCSGKVRNPFQTKEGYRPSCCDQEGKMGSEEVVPGTSFFPSSETGMSGNFWGRIKGAKYRFALQDGMWHFP